MNDGKCMHLCAAGAALLLGACAAGPNFHRPETGLPAAWKAAGPATAAEPAKTALWWRSFQDPELTSLVERALGNNLDLQLAEARLRQARAARGVLVGGFWPNLTASGSGQRGASGRSAPASTVQAGLDAAWEFDIFGGTRRGVESAGAAVEATQAGMEDVQVTLAAEVALAYLQVRATQEEIAIARENLSDQKHTAGLIRQRLKVGFSSALDAANADAQVATTASGIPPLDTGLQQAIHALGVLTGKPPTDLLGELSQPGVIPPSPPEVPVGLPSDLIRRRPDIRAAEAQLHAATAQIGVAVADFFPRFSLTGSAGFQSSLLRTLFSTDNRTWAAGPSVSWPIFQGGSIVANVHVQEALRDQAFLSYQKTVLVALQEVEDALVAFGNEKDHGKALAEAVIQNRRAFDLSTKLYTQGEVDFLTVLVAEGSLYSSETAFAQSRQAESGDIVALYKALGGGWEKDGG